MYVPVLDRTDILYLAVVIFRREYYYGPVKVILEFLQYLKAAQSQPVVIPSQF